jgi:hypothetical protein
VSGFKAQRCLAVRWKVKVVRCDRVWLPLLATGGKSALEASGER